MFVHRDIARYIIELVSKTRNSPLIRRGASPRATLSLAAMARACAYASGRDYVSPRDIGYVFISTINHRIILSSEAASKNMDAQSVLNELFKSVKPPRI